MHFQVYQKRNWIGSLQWRWRLIANNNKIIATSGESYTNRVDCVSALDLVKAFAPEARVDYF